MNDLISSVMTMKLDVYRQIDEQDPDTGALKREWQYIKTMPCHAKGIVSNTSSVKAGDKQAIGTKYSNTQVLQIRTIEKINFREKITRISDPTGNVIWVESNFPTDTPTVFEIMGLTPITDPFGSVLGYNMTAKRSENQTIGF